MGVLSLLLSSMSYLLKLKMVGMSVQSCMSNEINSNNLEIWCWGISLRWSAKNYASLLLIFKDSSYYSLDYC